MRREFKYWHQVSWLVCLTPPALEYNFWLNCSSKCMLVSTIIKKSMQCLKNNTVGDLVDNWYHNFFRLGGWKLFSPKNHTEWIVALVSYQILTHRSNGWYYILLEHLPEHRWILLLCCLRMTPLKIDGVASTIARRRGVKKSERIRNSDYLRVMNTISSQQLSLPAVYYVLRQDILKGIHYVGTVTHNSNPSNECLPSAKPTISYGSATEVDTQSGQLVQRLHCNDPPRHNRCVRFQRHPRFRCHSNGAWCSFSTHYHRIVTAINSFHHHLGEDEGQPNGNLMKSKFWGHLQREVSR